MMAKLLLSPKIVQKNYIVGLLEMICQELELPNAQRKIAESAYVSAGNWLNECPNLGKLHPEIFAQGSMALGTTVKPLHHEDFDVDLVCHLTAGDERLPQAKVKNEVGDRLASSKVYEPKLEEYKRCWRLNYAEETKLHLDITPAVNNSICPNGGICVTDRELRKWYPTNPISYVVWFDTRSRNKPKFIHSGANTTELPAIRANVEPLPDQLPLKGLLRRCVQLIKRHRSIRFEKRPEKAPISIILTTLAARSYEAATLSGRVYETEFDLLLEVIAGMPRFIERRHNGAAVEWWIPNETTEGENFAEKWNKDSELALAFYEWHKLAIADFSKLADQVDQGDTYTALEHMTGKSVTASVRNRVTANLSQSRAAGLLKTGPDGVLTLAAGLPVRGNTFFGR